jgi:hypothetical protein
MGVFIPCVTTFVSPEDMRPALTSAWTALWGEVPSLRSTLVLAAHYDLETGGGASCKNFNVGNKKAKKDGSWGDWTTFQTWELMDSVVAARDEAASTPEEPCKRVGGNPNGKIKMIYGAGHPKACFRAFTSLEAGIENYLQGLKTKFTLAWDQVLAGDPKAFATALKHQHYYTAALDEYQRGMVSRFYRLAGAGRMKNQGEIMLALQYLGVPDIRSFQAFSGLAVDGIAGPITKGALALSVDEKAAA